MTELEQLRQEVAELRRQIGRRRPANNDDIFGVPEESAGAIETLTPEERFAQSDEGREMARLEKEAGEESNKGREVRNRFTWIRSARAGRGESVL